MPVLNSIAGLADEMRAWRRHLHQNPELNFDCYGTAAFVVERLKEFGIEEIHTGIATSGVVALIKGREAGPTIALRADMDALPLEEITGLDYASKTPGVMHACGHDGHTTMLLGAAKYLAETRNFAGTVALIFQPAEELGGGARVMVEEGVLDRFDISEIYALHNMPGRALGSFHTTPGAFMAAVDDFTVHIKGVGGHGAKPHTTCDPVVAACGMVQALQTIVARNNAPGMELVVSVTQIHTGSADNIIPETAYINGTVRSFDKTVQQMVIRRMNEIIAGSATAYGVEAELIYNLGYPATVNDPARAEFAANVAREIGLSVDAAATKDTSAEDFSYFLEARPGAYLFLGNGESAGLHSPSYNFNDEAAPYGASFFARIAEKALPIKG